MTNKKLIELLQRCILLFKDNEVECKICSDKYGFSDINGVSIIIDTDNGITKNIILIHVNLDSNKKENV